MQKLSTVMLLTCVLWYAVATTMNTFVLIAALILTLTVLPYWAFITAAKTGRKPVKWLLLSIVLPLAGPLFLAVSARKDIARVAQQEKDTGRKSIFERKFGTWGGLIPYVAVLLAVLTVYVITKSGSGTPFVSTEMPYTGPVRYIDTTNGNETANIVNGGMLLSTGLQELFTNLEDGGTIYTVSVQEGNKIRRYSKDKGYNFCVFSDYIYYINKSDENRIYRMNTADPDKKERISDDPVTQFCINEMIYYTNKDDKDRIYRIDTEGKGRVRLGTKRSADLFQLYGYLYYLNLDDGGKIYQMTTEGKHVKKIVNDKVGEMFFTNGRIYYINLDDGHRIYSVTVEGLERKKENDDGVDCICSDGVYIYYANLNDNGRIYKWDFENSGTAVRMNDDIRCVAINIYSNDMMYISNGSQKFVDSHSGAPIEKFAPVLDSRLNSGSNEADTSKVPKPESQEDVAAALGIEQPQNTPSQPDVSAQAVDEITKTRQQYADYVFPDGTAYNGEMKDGLPDGRGSAIAVNGDSYAGNWKAGKREGYGGFTKASDKSVYMGQWENDKKNGEGLLQKDGQMIKGIWKDDEYIGPVENN